MLQVSRLFSDGAVLCRNREIRLFGLADEQVTAILADAAGQELARDTAPAINGRFLCLLPPLPAKTHCTLTFSSGDDTVTFSDIALGDVYLASGQSNMELELQNADEGTACVQTHENPLVRYYNVPKRSRPGRETDDANACASWVRIAPGTGKDMSAAAYFFAMKLQPQIGVPVGVIDCYWGGTSITCWMEKDTLLQSGEGKRYLDEYAEKTRGKTMEAYLAEEAVFLSDLDAWNKAVADLKEKHPGISGQEINRQAGPCPWFPPAGPGSPYRPGGLYDTMMRYVIPATLTAVLYYQGEEDTYRTCLYEVLLADYIAQLRRDFGPDDLPFINVQLPMWIAAGAQDSFTWPRLRLAQQLIRDQVNRTGLVTLLDQGEFDNIHPTNKRVVGERLCQEAKRMLYPGLPFEEAPRAVEKHTEGNKLSLRFSQEIREREGGDALMEIAGADGVFRPASMKIQKDTAVLESPDVPRPVSVRYAWTDYAIVRLFGLNDLPLMPFWLK